MKRFIDFLIERIECSSEQGITLGAIEGIIAQLRMLRKRNLKSKAVQDALQDLRDNSPIKSFIKEYYFGPSIDKPGGGKTLPIANATKPKPKSKLNAKLRQNEWPTGRGEESTE